MSRILLVEDSMELRLILDRYADEAGIEMDAAGSGEEALGLIRTRAYDLVFLDLHLPGGLDGFQVFDKMKTLASRGGSSRPPVLALTASSFPEDKDRCLAMGFEGFVPKPFRKADILDIFRRYLRPDVRSMEKAAEDDDIKELLPGYIQNRKRDIESMRRSWAAGDRSGVEAVAHRVKGSAGAFGLERLGEISGLIERLAREGPAEAVEAALDEFDAFLRSLGPALSGLKIVEKPEKIGGENEEATEEQGGQKNPHRG